MPKTTTKKLFIARYELLSNSELDRIWDFQGRARQLIGVIFFIKMLMINIMAKDVSYIFFHIPEVNCLVRVLGEHSRIPRFCRIPMSVLSLIAKQNDTP